MASNINLDIYNGSFPSFDGLEVGTPEYKRVYASALTWLSVKFSTENFKEFLIQYLRSIGEITEALELVPAIKFIAIGKIAYIKLQGIDLSNESTIFFNEHLADVQKIANVMYQAKLKDEQYKPKVRSVLDDIHYVSNKLEDFIDDNCLLTTSNCYELLREYKTRQGLLKSIRDKFVSAYEEYKLARTTYAEYFESVSDEDIKYRLRCYQQIIEDVDFVFHNKKSARKNIVRRASSEKKIAKVSYCQHDLDLKIQSVDPIALIGAKAVVLYNRRRKRLTKLVSNSEKGLTVKGTTIHGFDLKLSGTKTLRKPEVQLHAFRRADRIKRIDILYNDIRGKIFAASGRLGDDVLIIKVFAC